MLSLNILKTYISEISLSGPDPKQFKRKALLYCDSWEIQVLKIFVLVISPEKFYMKHRGTKKLGQGCLRKKTTHCLLISGSRKLSQSDNNQGHNHRRAQQSSNHDGTNSSRTQWPCGWQDRKLYRFKGTEILHNIYIVHQNMCCVPANICGTYCVPG